MNKKLRYSPEVRERAVRMVLTSEHENPSRWAAKKPGVTSDAAAKIKQLERENRELKQANEILHKASAFFAQAELECKPRR